MMLAQQKQIDLFYLSLPFLSVFSQPPTSALLSACLCCCVLLSASSLLVPFSVSFVFFFLLILSFPFFYHLYSLWLSALFIFVILSSHLSKKLEFLSTKIILYALRHSYIPLRLILQFFLRTCLPSTCSSYLIPFRNAVLYKVILLEKSN